MLEIPVALFGCFGTCVAYAAILSTRRGRKFTVGHTWITVVIGVLIVLGWYALVDLEAALRVLVFFVVGGAPMIARSWWLEVAYRNEYTQLRREEEQRIRQELHDETWRENYE